MREAICCPEAAEPEQKEGHNLALGIRACLDRPRPRGLRPSGRVWCDGCEHGFRHSLATTDLDADPDPYDYSHGDASTHIDAEALADPDPNANPLGIANAVWDSL